MPKTIVILLLLFVFFAGSCKKEYSYEGGAIPVISTDTVRVPVPVNEFPLCPACTANTGSGLSQWTFKSGNSVLCGTLDTAISNPDRNAFTFFGPSSCSGDTGMVMTVYLITDSLNRDRTNITTYNNAFYFYERVTPSYIFMSHQGSGFTVTITSYDHQARICTGTFSGTAFRNNGGGASISSGKFKVKLL